jgi:hypothetical protein
MPTEILIQIRKITHSQVCPNNMWTQSNWVGQYGGARVQFQHSGVGEARGPNIHGQPGEQSETPSQKKKKNSLQDVCKPM